MYALTGVEKLSKTGVMALDDTISTGFASPTTYPVFVGEGVANSCGTCDAE